VANEKLPKDTAKQFAEQEAIIRRNKGDVLAIGNALLTIHRLKPAPYKKPHGKYDNLKQYAKDVWGIERRDFYRAVEWAETLELIAPLCPMGDSEPALHVQIKPRHARELYKLKDDPQAMARAFKSAKSKATKLPTSAEIGDEVSGEIRHRATLQLDGIKANQRTDRRLAEHFHCADMLDGLPFLQPASFDLVITSPPYGIGKAIKYGTYKDTADHGQYLARLEQWMRVIVKMTKENGGRMCINVPNTYGGGERDAEYIHPLPTELILIMRKIEGVRLYQEIVWDRMQLTKAQERTWGSDFSPACPNVRRRSERILVFVRGDYRREVDPATIDITTAEFVEWSQDVWRIGAQRGIKWHPCPFPIDIPTRLLKFYGCVGDRVLDPFGGCGTTALACSQLGREFEYVDVDKTYTARARQRVLDSVDQRDKDKAA
jgi:site-specific DNA-methyltransferase (adenine-specific)